MFVANVLAPLTSLEEHVLEALHTIGLGWGLAIVGLTVMIRASTLPLVVRQFRRQAEMRKHMPELKRIREMHKGDPQRLRAETTAYYREHSVNPLGSFAPMLIQIPIFISLYLLLRTDASSGLFDGAGFLFIPDLTAKPHGVVLVTMLTLYVASQIGGSMIATRAMQSSHRRIAMVLPLLFVGVIARFPAGLAVYSVTTSFWTFGQQFTFWRLNPAGSATLIPEALGSDAEAGEPQASAAPPAEDPPAARRPHSRSKKKRRSRSRR